MPSSATISPPPPRMRLTIEMCIRDSAIDADQHHRADRIVGSALDFGVGERRPRLRRGRLDRDLHMLLVERGGQIIAVDQRPVLRRPARAGLDFIDVEALSFEVHLRFHGEEGMGYSGKGSPPASGAGGPSDQTRSFSTSASVVPSSDGLADTVMPAASIAAILLSASPLPPDTMAPAWPMRRPGGAVRPAMKPTIGFLRPRLALSLIHI